MRSAPDYDPESTDQVDDWLSDWPTPRSPDCTEIARFRAHINETVVEAGGRPLSQEWWARALGVTVRTFHRWERGVKNSSGKPYVMPAAAWLWMHQVGNRVRDTIQRTRLPSSAPARQEGFQLSPTDPSS